MRFTRILSTLLLLQPTLLFAASHSPNDDTDKPIDEPCTVHSPTTNSYFDLNSINVHTPKDGKKPGKNDRTESWHARGYDYGANFTLNFCGPVMEADSLKNVVGVERAMWKNVSAFYEQHGKTYSLGQSNSELIFRGRKLVLNYTDGSPCDSEYDRRGILDPDDGDDRKRPTKPSPPQDSMIRRKSTIISLLCERDATAPKVAAAFVGASPDECSYFFEVRSSAACATANVQKQSLGPSGVFGVIAMIAILVYVIGGVVYQRVVMHQRGWRQLPNYALWASIFSFLGDMFIILTSSCSRCLPRRKGYSRVSLNGDERRGRTRTQNADDENRLIDQLDEEWDE